MAEIIDSLKRLERAGSENSRATKKLLDAANTLADYIIDQLGIDRIEAAIGGELYVLPRGVRAGALADYDVCLELPTETERWVGWYVGDKLATRDSALRLAELVASGWLDEVAAWLEEQVGNADVSADVLIEHAPA